MITTLRILKQMNTTFRDKKDAALGNIKFGTQSFIIIIIHTNKYSMTI